MKPLDLLLDLLALFCRAQFPLCATHPLPLERPERAPAARPRGVAQTLPN